MFLLCCGKLNNYCIIKIQIKLADDFKFLAENVQRSSQFLPQQTHTLSPIESQFSIHVNTPKGV